MQYEGVALVVAGPELLATGLETLILRNVPRTQVRVFADWSDALDTQDDETLYSLALIDADTVAADGATAASALRRKYPKIGMIIVATQSQRSEVVKYLRWGAHGVVFKGQPVAEIAAAVNVVLSGGLSVPKLTGSSISTIEPSPLRLKVRTADGRAVVTELSAQPDCAPGSLARLSERQAAVLELLARGLPNKGIARELGLAEATVKAHVNAVFRALNVNNRASAAVLAARASGLDPAAE